MTQSSRPDVHGRRLRDRSPMQLAGLGVFALALLPGLALTALSPNAWPIPVVALVGFLTIWVAGGRQGPGERHVDRRVEAEASSGIAQMERWLAERHHT